MRLKRLFLALTFLFSPLFISSAQEPILLEHGGGVWTVEFSPVNASLVASAGESNLIKLWNLKNNTARTLRGHTDIVSSAAFSPNGELLASVSDDRTIKLWNVRTQQNIATLRDGTPYRSVAFSPDGQLLATGGWIHVKLWDVHRRAEIATLQHDQSVRSVTFSHDGQFLAAGDGSRDGPGTVKVWNVKSRKVVVSLDANPKEVKAVEFSSDNRYLASSGWNGHLKIWDVPNWELLRTIPATGDYDIAFSPDGKRLASTTRGRVSLWDVELGEQVASLSELTGWQHPVDFAHDGTSFATGGEDGFVRLYNIEDIEEDIESRLQALQQPGMVRLIYFLPSDRPARPDRVTALRQLIKDVQQFFADEIQSHGFGRKTFSVETDKAGEPVVHRIDGKSPEEHYYQEGTGRKVWTEVREHFDAFQHIYFIAIDLSSERLHGGQSCGEAVLTVSSLDGGGIRGRHKDITQGEEILGGFTVIPASGDCFEDNRGNRHRLGIPTHELGHAFGLEHDFREARNSDYIMAYGNQSRLAKCSAEWLSVSHFFNTESVSPNTPAEIQLLSTRAYSKDTISFRFKVTDPDGLHQAQLLLPDITSDGAAGPYRLFDCKKLDDKTSTIASVVRTAELVDKVTLQVIDVNGNITWATFPVQLAEAVLDKNFLDINGDGIVNTSDLTSVISHFGQRGKNPADVNEDGVVNTVDLLLVAAEVSSLSQQAVGTFAVADVQKWLTDAKLLEVENTILKKGIIFLEHLLAEITLLSKPTNTATGPSKAIFEGHTEFVSSVAFSPDGQTLASASGDGTIRLWNPHTAQLKTLLIGHTEAVNSIAFSPDGQTLASTSRDTTLRLWDLHTEQHKTTFRTHTGFSYAGFDSVAFSPDGQILVTGGDYGDPVIRLWNLRNEENIRTLTGHKGWVTSVAFSPDGQTLATGSEDKTAKLWNPHNGQLKKTFTGHTEGVESIAFSPDGQTLATGSRDRTIRLWNPQNGQEKKTLTGYDWMNPVVFSPDGEMLASGSQDHRIRFWNAKTDEYKNTLQEGAGRIMSIVFSPDGEMLASGREDGTVRLWELQTLLDQDPNLTLGPNKITGPWLWMIAPTEAGQGGANSNNVDSLAVASGGNVTEADVAANGAKAGDVVGDYAWTLGEIASSGSNNVNDLINKIGLVDGGDPKSTADDRDIDDHSSYALITLESATTQLGVKMRVGSDDSIKVWLNGEVVHNNPVDRGANDFQDTFKVDLNKGDNLLLVKVSELRDGWSMFVGIDADVKTKTVPAAPMLSASEMLLPTETVLLPNYPNPFNPETWIPYQLSNPAEVTLHIYSVNGTLVRTLALGHQSAGMYQSRTRAAYWDGKNEAGETVASGIYFYTLTVGEFTATRKMLIRK